MVAEVVCVLGDLPIPNYPGHRAELSDNSGSTYSSVDRPAPVLFVIPGVDRCGSLLDHALYKGRPHSGRFVCSPRSRSFVLGCELDDSAVRNSHVVFCATGADLLAK